MAINGVYAVFRVEAVMNAAGVPRERNDRRARDAKAQTRKRENLFSGILGDAMRERTESTEPVRTAVYGRNGRMAETRMERREYHY